MADGRIEQDLRLCAEPPLSEAAVLVGGGPDTQGKLARHARGPPEPGRSTAIPWLGISLLAALDIPLNDLLSARFATYRMIHMPAVAALPPIRPDHGVRERVSAVQGRAQQRTPEP